LNNILVDHWYSGDSSRDAGFLYIDGHVRIYYGDKTPVCTFVFDREAYEPAFFRRLWEKYKIAIITYRKNVKNEWSSECFKSVAVSVLQQIVNMQLCEQGTELGGYWFREVRRQSETGHQTSIVTTHPSLELSSIAGRMFSRWSQENFFRYLILDYDFDKLVSFGTEPVDPEKEIVNPQYRKITHQLKKLRQIQRLEARFFPLVQLAIDQPLDDLPAITIKQIGCKDKIEFYRKQEEELKTQRSQIKPRS
jgi:hypothetical protein